MRRALNNLNADLVKQLPAGEEYVARVTSDEGNIGRGFLSKFQDPEERYPVILTTSQLLTTGVDAPTCQSSTSAAARRTSIPKSPTTWTRTATSSARSRSRSTPRKR